jgi:ribosomal protein S18 acetylase RimI-like enzyme
VEAPAPGYYWKIPFFWEVGCREPVSADIEVPGGLRFEPTQPVWLRHALGEAMANSPDESDHLAVRRAGADGAADELLAICPTYFEHEDGWWRAAVGPEGHAVGFVLPALFRDQTRWEDGIPRGTVVYIAVAPEFRGHGYVHTLLDEATRVLLEAGCRRIVCDTAWNNLPMIGAFRRAGYLEQAPWQRPLE